MFISPEATHESQSPFRSELFLFAPVAAQNTFLVKILSYLKGFSRTARCVCCCCVRYIISLFQTRQTNKMWVWVVLCLVQSVHTVTASNQIRINLYFYGAFSYRKVAQSALQRLKTTTEKKKETANKIKRRKLKEPNHPTPTGTMHKYIHTHTHAYARRHTVNHLLKITNHNSNNTKQQPSRRERKRDILESAGLKRPLTGDTNPSTRWAGPDHQEVPEKSKIHILTNSFFSVRGINMLDSSPAELKLTRDQSSGFTVLYSINLQFVVLSALPCTYLTI